MAKTTKTVTEHLEAGDRLQAHIDDADELIKKLKAELEFSRKRLEWLKAFCHPKFIGIELYKDGRKGGDAIPIETAINLDIADINSLLGDRA